MFDLPLLVNQLNLDLINPLKSNSTLFVVRIDDNTFRLCQTAFKSNKIVPDVISFTSTGSGHVQQPQLQMTPKQSLKKNSN